ncbi:hypothetical protein [Mucilaginibacter sp. UYCu711]|uniref:hypothetical protein n=1 Tax=Mucilaginibacter sp. UYCu711 TaxID=3156339 RepID=UPI003D253936
MPALTDNHKKILGPLIKPFQRSGSKSIETDLLTGEDSNEPFLNFIHDGIENNHPIGYVEITEDELDTYQILNYGSYAEKCFLWVIDDISIKIMWEKTSNVLRSEARPEKPYVCHTNITGCKEAYIGGEMYFCTNGNIYINFKSDRYGSVDVDAKKAMAKEYMEFVNYKNVILIGE